MRTAARDVTALPFSAGLQRRWKTKLKGKNPSKYPSGKEGAAFGCASAAWWGRRCAPYQICRNRCRDESVGPVNQSAADDQHRYEERDGHGGTREEIKSLSAGSSRTSGPSSPARVRTSLSCASSPFSPGDPTQQAANPHPAPPSPKIPDREPGSREEIKAGESAASPLAPSVTAAGCTEELLTY